MLGLLRRLHQLDIQSRLQAESKETGIIFLDQKHQIHRITKEARITSYQEFTNASICEAVKKAEEKAKLSIETLGMKSLLVKKKLWDTLPKEENNLQEDLEDSTDSEDDDKDGDNCPDESTAVTQEMMTENASEIEEDVYKLSKNELISSQAVAQC